MSGGWLWSVLTFWPFWPPFLALAGQIWPNFNEKVHNFFNNVKVWPAISLKIFWKIANWGHPRIQDFPNSPNPPSFLPFDHFWLTSDNFPSVHTHLLSILAQNGPKWTEKVRTDHSHPPNFDRPEVGQKISKKNSRVSSDSGHSNLSESVEFFGFWQFLTD